ncbi:uncharacterized protein LOC144478396 isoform X2 [Augochlora pura]
MQWRRQRRVTHVIGSSNHVLLLARYQDDPPGEEDEEEGLRNGYVKNRENESGTHNFERHRQDGYKSWRSASGGSSGYNGGGSRSHRDESAGSPSQPKTNFNEDEYMRIATPRQDMLFKKGYFSKKKLWAGNASTSATPSTTESQSASHSTADGSETTEDQQLLDRDCGNGENTPVVEPRAQLGYGTFYDHASGYYYEYPVMLFGPAPVPAPVGPSVLAAVPCEPVPLRPIEWINPAFVHKMSDQPYCMMNYQTGTESAAVVREEEQETTEVPVENTNGTCNESGTGTGSASCSGSVVGDGDEQPAEATATKENQTDSDLREEEQTEELYMDEPYVEDQCMVNGMADGPYLKPVLMQQPVHVSHVIPAVPQPYMYPGHYMFGPPLVNVNGVTIQGGPMIRTTNVAVMSAACAKRRKKKKRRKQRLAAGNTEDEEEGEYSSECDTGLSSSRLPWTDCSTSTTTTTTTTTTSTRTLNPECKEFQLRSVAELNGTSVPAIPTSGDTPISEESSTTNQLSVLSLETASVEKTNESFNGITDDSQNGDDETVSENSIQVVRLPKTRSTPLEEQNGEAKRLMNCLADKEQTPVNNDVAVEVLSSSNSMNNVANDASNGNDHEEMNGIKEEVVALTNGNLDFDSNNEDAALTSKTTSLHNDERTSSRSSTPKTVSVENTDNGENHESLTNAKSSLPKRKYSVKGTKFMREPTPGPDLNDAAETNLEKANDDTQSLNNISPNDYTKEDSTFEREKTDNKLSSNCTFDAACNHLSNEDPIEACNDDSGFESQTRHSEYPITEAVTQWLRRVNSPDVFITSTISDSETEDEDEVEEPPKNLQGNPMPALSANNRADNLGLSRATNCGEFARSSNVKSLDQPDGNNGGSRKKKEGKKRSGERRRVRHVDGKLDEVVSSSDSCGQRDDSVRKKHLTKDVGDVCEFTEEDSVAGMRVASNSRMDSKRVNARRTKRQGGRSNRDPVNNNEKIKHADNENDNNEKMEMNEDAVNVKTYEKGEIVVSEDGKLLTTSGYETLWNNNNAAVVVPVTKSETTKETARIIENGSNSVDEENASGILSLDSIEELDVLECWEAETIEPVITPKKIMQCRGVSCEGEAGEEDKIDLKINVDYVQKYYRLARESASIEEDLSSKVTVDSVPNRSDDSRAETTTEKQNNASNVPIEEAFEAYESCYNGKSSFLAIDPKIFKSRTLYGQEGDGPIPCKAVCCNIQ